MASHELSPRDIDQPTPQYNGQLNFRPIQYFDRRSSMGSDDHSEHTVIRRADSGHSHFYIARPLTEHTANDSVGLMVVNSPNQLKHYITRLSLPPPTERDPYATQTMHAMLAFAAFRAIAVNEVTREARVFASVEQTDPDAIQEIYNDKNDPKIWEYVTTPNHGQTRIMGTLAHKLVGYSAVVLTNNVIKEGNRPPVDADFPDNHRA